MNFSIAIGNTSPELQSAAEKLFLFLKDNQKNKVLIRKHDEELSDDHFYKNADALIVLGGDGAIIHEASKASHFETPVLGINYGHLGYLAELEDLDYFILSKLFTKEYRIEERMMLEIEMENRIYTALNDVAVSKIKPTGIVDLEYICNRHSIGIHRSDGAILSTPTGSTGYALSCGGSVIDPMLHVICLTPICPHSLSSRQILFSENSEIEIYNRNRTKEAVAFSTDGQNTEILEYGKHLTIRKSGRKAYFIRLTDRYFYENIKNKLID